MGEEGSEWTRWEGPPAAAASGRAQGGAAPPSEL